MPVVTADTSFLFSLYGSDSNSAAARAWLSTSTQPITITALNGYELTNAVHFATFRKLITRADAQATLSAFEADLRAGLLHLVPCDFSALFEEGRRLSDTHTARAGHRSFNILHVATARLLKAGTFLSFDANQKKLATAAGLSLRP